jgi:hypothetical protein
VTAVIVAQLFSTDDVDAVMALALTARALRDTLRRIDPFSIWIDTLTERVGVPVSGPMARRWLRQQREHFARLRQDREELFRISKRAPLYVRVFAYNTLWVMSGAAGFSYAT